MKVVHITYSDAGGAGLAAFRIHRELLNQGIESKMLVAEKESTDDNVFIIERSPSLMYVPPKNKLIRRMMKLLRAKGHFLNEKEQFEHRLKAIPASHQTFFTSPLSNYDLARHPLVREADIIHLHWVANLIDYPSFFPNINKPIVWTLHDENLAFGGFHYSRDYDAFYPYYSDIEDSFLKIKASSLGQCNTIHVVALSLMMKDFYLADSCLSNRAVTIIHNGIDTSTFRVIDKRIGRMIYHIPENNLVIVFCCLYLNEKRKGLSELIEALDRFNRKDITLLCIGNGHFDGKTSLDIRYTGQITNGDLLAMTYSCGDVFAFPSFQEAFAQTPLEAIACGLPIVAFPCSGMEELINEKNGFMCKGFSSDALFHGLNAVLGHNYDRQRLHNDIASRFSITQIVKEYQCLYRSIA